MQLADKLNKQSYIALVVELVDTKDLKSFMEKYTGRKWWISFIHKLIKRYEDDYYIENEEIIRNQICQVEMERSICDV